MNTQAPEGDIILVDKPLGWTSFQAVKKIKYGLKVKKAGHAGTLDPLASGLLIVCTERSTRKIAAIQDQEKEYTGTITLGAETPSYDLETEPVNFRDYGLVTIEKINSILPEFTGWINQVPPIFSAIKVDGKRAYKMARQGTNHVLESRKVLVTELQITGYDAPDIHFRVVCSKGTYIRSLAHDIGVALGCGGYLSRLRRTRIGEYSVANALSPEQCIQQKKLQQATSEPGDAF